ncbi:AraC family transcriptional regulator [Herbiconiux sp. CPCC 203407]|uniref:AraC family transcriptional regulator n=1 Tax=Herbiconiux oxytropis TaxID=2970915 RepID=A0AA42BT69_9MICO|nr:AraC family transcriptional regulator [Herbiconiux oxytropis]MCS5720492.1 AraC family transcriptional regulator [Herbiconiux oxytropis]MCS5726065.1 AraC family transcriptional regulator [Herbiconiux oxytropis]
MNTPLKHHNVFQTPDLAEARNEVARVFCDHRLTMTDPRGRLDTVLNGALVGEVGLNYLRYGDEVRISPGRLDDFYLVQIPLAGRAAVKVGDHTVMSDRRRASLISPTEAVDMLWSDGCEQLIVYLDRHAVERMAGAGDEPGPVVFAPGVDLDAPAVRSWLRIVHLMRDEIEAGDTVLTSPLAHAHFEHLLIGGLLAAQPNSALVEERSPSWRPGAPSRAVRRATELIEAEPERAWRVAELASASGTTVRQLQESFQRERGASPMELLRRTRLERARAELLEADATRSTVSEIATKWGFFHLGRFSVQYRETFQESPSQTLAR